MEHSDRSLLLLESCNTIERHIVESACQITGIDIIEVFSENRHREVVNTRCAIANIYNHLNYPSTELGKKLGVTQRLAYNYVQNHEDKLSDIRYKNLYTRLLKLVDEFGDDLSSTDQMIENLNMRVSRMEQRVNHLSKLIIE